MITDDDMKTKIQSALSAARPKDRIITTRGAVAHAGEFGACETEFIKGGRALVKRAVSGQWVGYYWEGVLRHEDRI